MLSPINAFDVGTVNAGAQAGMRRGMINGSAPALNMMVDGLMKRMDTHLAAQQEQANSLALVQAKAKAENPMIPVPEGQPEVKITSYVDPATGKALSGSSIWSPKEGRYVPNHPTAMTPLTAKQEFQEAIYKDLLPDKDGAPNVIQQGAATPTAIGQGSARIQVRAPNGKVGHIPAAQLDEALKQGFTKI